MSPGSRWGDCFAREDGRFAAGLRLGTIAAALWISLEIDLRWAHLPKGEVMSVLGLAVPVAWWASPAALWAGRVALWVAAIAWSLGHARRLAAWTTAAAMLWLGSLYWEDLPWLRHKIVLPFWLLVLLAAAEHARAPPGQAPRWVREGAVFALAAFYAGAGLSKLLAVGPRWGDGVALQLWLWRLGDPDSAVRAWAIASPALSAALAGAALALELAAALAVPFPRSRPWLGAGLVALHLGIDRALHIDFRANLLLVALVLLPWSGRSRSAAARGEQREACPEGHGPQGMSSEEGVAERGEQGAGEEAVGLAGEQARGRDAAEGGGEVAARGEAARGDRRREPQQLRGGEVDGAEPGERGEVGDEAERERDAQRGRGPQAEDGAREPGDEDERVGGVRGRHGALEREQVAGLQQAEVQSGDKGRGDGAGAHR